MNWLARKLHGPAMTSDCSFCARRTFVCFHDERRCVKGHTHFKDTVPRLTKLRIGR